jgi:NhaP-type Na+/H+ and K+/H+ antiporter
VTGDSPAVGRKLGDLRWPSAGAPVSVLRNRSLRPPDSQITLAAGDRVSLLVPAPQNSHPPHTDDGSRDPTASREATSGSSSP